MPPNKPVSNPKEQSPNANDRIQPVRQVCISFASWWIKERRDEKEDLAGHEEDGYDVPDLEWPRGVGLLPSQDEESDHHEQRYHAGWITLDVYDEIERVAKGYRHNDDEGWDKMKQQTSRRRSGRPRGCPESLSRNYPFLCQLLVDTRLGESDGQDVSESGECDEYTA